MALVKKSSKTCICQVYKSTDIVKPYFDVDIYHYDHKEVKEVYINTVIKKCTREIRKNIPVACIIYIAQNHRFDANINALKYSFHFILSGIKMQVADIRNICVKMNTDLNQPVQIFDTSVYKSHGKFRFSNQIKTGTQNKPILSHPKNLAEYVIHNVKESDILFEYKLEDNKNTTRIKNLTTASIKTNNGFELTDIQKSIIETILFELPIVHVIEDYG